MRFGSIWYLTRNSFHNFTLNIEEIELRRRVFHRCLFRIMDS